MRISMFSALILMTIASTGSTFGNPMQEKNAPSHTNPSPPQDVKNPILKGLHLAVRTEKERFERGEPIVLKVSVKNDAATVVYLPNTYHPEWDYKFEVTNEEKKSVSLTADGELLTKNIAIFRRVGIEIKPGGEIDSEFQIDKLFEMSTPGWYSITIKHAVWEPTNGVHVIVISNTLRVRVGG